MLRLFVGLKLPEDIAETLIAHMGGVAAARWQNREQLHLTLKFIGEVNRHQAADIDAALNHISAAPFDVSLHGYGAFDKDGLVHTLYAQAHPAEKLRTLAGKIEQALQGVGIARDSRAYQPHVTLARLNRSAGPVGDFLEHAPPLPPLHFPVSAFTLFESVLAHGGAVYSALETYPFNEMFE